nr:MAG TPA: hypothetical protein [Caudoviricetes sp.]
MCKLWLKAHYHISRVRFLQNLKTVLVGFVHQ